MDKEITLEQAKELEKIYHKKYHDKQVLSILWLAFLFLLCITLLLLGFILVFDDGENNYVSDVIGGFMIVLSFPFCLFLGVVFPKETFFNIYEEELLKTFLFQEAKKFVINQNLKFSINKRSLRKMKFDECVTAYLDQKIRYNPQKSLDEQLTFNYFLLDIQDYLNEYAKNFNEEQKLERIFNDLKKYVDKIKCEYEDSEKKLIEEKMNSWCSYARYLDRDYDFTDAINYVTHYDGKIIGTKKKINEFEQERKKLLKDSDIRNKERFNNEVRKYCFSNSINYLLPIITKQSKYSEIKNTFNSRSRTYISHCWKCKTPINEDVMTSPRRCHKCGGYYCKRCGACLCDRK